MEENIIKLIDGKRFDYSVLTGWLKRFFCCGGYCKLFGSFSYKSLICKKHGIINYKQRRGLHGTE